MGLSSDSILREAWWPANKRRQDHPDDTQEHVCTGQGKDQKNGQFFFAQMCVCVCILCNQNLVFALEITDSDITSSHLNLEELGRENVCDSN